MNLVFEKGSENTSAEDDSNVLNYEQEAYERNLSAGTLFPEEIRNAERNFRHLNKFARSSERWSPAKKPCRHNR